MIEKDFDISFIADLSLREKQIQQNYRPVIAVHKWFARRPGTLFRGLLLSEFSKMSLNQAFYQANDLSGIHVADPFMGGGTPVLEANRIGCDTYGFDINPMSYWIVKQEIEQLDIDSYSMFAEDLRMALEKEIGHLYRTRCVKCGYRDAHVKYFLWVKVRRCIQCGKDFDLFPGYLVSSNSRHPLNVFVCPVCGELNETSDRNSPGTCKSCNSDLVLNGPAKRNRCVCPACGTENRFPVPQLGPSRHRMFAIEYYCPKCKSSHIGRFFKKPDNEDIQRYNDAGIRWDSIVSRFVPEEEIPSGDETNRLHRWGYTKYREMFNKRQLLGLELSGEIISKIQKDRVRNALATNLSDLLRYQNMLCRYDTRALKSLDIFSVHGFPVGLIQCESNFIGIMEPHRGMCIGSGGWSNIIEKYKKAKYYCMHPFEVKHKGRTKVIVPIKGEWIGDQINLKIGKQTRNVNITCRNAALSDLPDASLDAVLTDPPYFGNVQYAELMDFCYVWLRKLVGNGDPAFSADSTRNPDELTVNENMGRGMAHFTEGLSSVFQRMSKSLKPGAPFAFTYHHNSIESYFPVAVAILDSSLTCSASLPCPAEMGASIHINGTGSSIIDTIFVCRSTGIMQRKWLGENPCEVARIIEEDIKLLKAAHVIPTVGDMKCIAYGHLIRLAIWSLRHAWDKNESTKARIARVDAWLQKFGDWSDVKKYIDLSGTSIKMESPSFAIHESNAEYGAEHADISF